MLEKQEVTAMVNVVTVVKLVYPAAMNGMEILVM